MTNTNTQEVQVTVARTGEVPVEVKTAKDLGSNATAAAGGKVEATTPTADRPDPDDWSRDPFYKDVKMFAE